MTTFGDEWGEFLANLDQQYRENDYEDDNDDGDDYYPHHGENA